MHLCLHELEDSPATGAIRYAPSRSQTQLPIWYRGYSAKTLDNHQPLYLAVLGQSAKNALRNAKGYADLSALVQDWTDNDKMATIKASTATRATVPHILPPAMGSTPWSSTTPFCSRQRTSDPRFSWRFEVGLEGANTSHSY